MSTQDLQWLLLRKSNSFLVKQKGLGRVFSREPGNLASLHSYKFSGLVNDQSVGIVPAENRGVVVTTRKQKVAPNAIRAARSSTTVYVHPLSHISARVARAVWLALSRTLWPRTTTALTWRRVRKQRVPRVRAPRGAAARRAVAAPAEEQ